jgi:hypothetical protein
VDAFSRKLFLLRRDVLSLSVDLQMHLGPHARVTT